MERVLAADKYTVLCDKLFQGVHNRFVDFSRHVTASCHLMLTAFCLFVLRWESLVNSSQLETQWWFVFLLTWFRNLSPVSEYDLRTSSWPSMYCVCIPVSFTFTNAIIVSRQRVEAQLALEKEFDEANDICFLLHVAANTKIRLELHY